jgi:hypothetical protein
MTIKTLTETEFDALRPHLDNFEAKNVDAIRRIMVGGVKQKLIATELGVTKEAVSAMVGRVWKVHLEHGARPEGWETVHVTLPPEYALVVRNMAEIAHARKGVK